MSGPPPFRNGAGTLGGGVLLALKRQNWPMLLGAMMLAAIAVAGGVGWWLGSRTESPAQAGAARAIAQPAYARRIAQPRLAPSATHWLGTDDHGRDVALRLAYGTHLSLSIGVGAIGLALLLGLPGGLVAAAWQGRWVDKLLMQITDLALAFPPVLLALAIIAGLGFSLQNLILAVGVIYASQVLRVARTAALQQLGAEYVLSARALGCGPARVYGRHVLPNCLGPVLGVAGVGVPAAMLEGAALSFLGLGVQPPLPEWGRMLTDAREAMFTRPWLLAGPTAALMLTALSINLLLLGWRRPN